MSEASRNAAARAADLIRRRIGDAPVRAAVVLGTGLGSVTGTDPRDALFSYEDLPGFPQPGVSGHTGQLTVGLRGGSLVAWLRGRAHYYETGDSRAMAGAFETLAYLGVERLLLTSASGSTRANLPPGTLTLLQDHINFSGLNPLIGSGGDDRFVPMNDAYDPALAQDLMAAAARAGMALPRAIYMWFSGPSFETPAEVRMAALLGADLVGMSTVPETILARRLGMRVAGLSLVTNFAAGVCGATPDHEGTKSVAAAGARSMTCLLDAYFDPSGDATC